MRLVALEQTPPPDTAQWSSAIGHASTGKSGRVIERLQQEIDRLNREKQLLRLQHEEAERAKETLNASISYLRDRNSVYESSHESNLRQLQRKERQVEELKADLQREKLKTARAEEAARTAVANEDDWREQAQQAKSIAQQKEAEYDAIASCRNMDNDRQQNGLDRIKAHLEELRRQRSEDLEKQKRMEIIAEQQKQTIEQLDELTRKLTANFRLYRSEIDSAIEGLRSIASENDRLVQEKVEEMKRVTGEMRWFVNVETVLNGKEAPPQPPAPLHESQMTGRLSTSLESHSDEQSFATARSKEPSTEHASAPPSPVKKMSLDFRRHRRKGSSKAGK